MDDCIFCRIVRGEAPSWKVYETGTAYAFLDIHPVSAYHTLVIPKRHYVDVFDVPEADLLGVMAALKHVADLYHDRLGLRHAQVVNSSGAEAQQGGLPPALPPRPPTRGRRAGRALDPPPGTARAV